MNIAKITSLTIPKFISERNLFHSSIVLALIFWLTESLLHVYVFVHPGDTHTFIEELLPKDPNELWMRIIITALVLLLGFLGNISLRYISTTNKVNREILENSTNAYVAVRRDGMVEYLNPEAERLLNLSHYDDLGKELSDMLPELACALYKPLRKSISGQKAVIVDCFYPPTNKWLKVHINPNTTNITLSIQDVTHEKYYQQLMQQHMSIIDNSLDGLVSINRLGIVQTYSKSAESIFGYRCDEVIGKNVSMLMPEHHSRQHDEYINHYLKTGNAKLVGIGPYEVQAQHKDGSIFDMDLAVNETIVNDEIMFIANVRNISQRKGMQRKLEYLSIYDQLTSLPNRVLLVDTLKHAIKNASRHNKKFAVMFIDLDNFKETNDTYGHHAGDQLLVVAANILKESLRESDTVARLGGDEFVIILDDIKQADDAINAASKFTKKFNIPININGHEIKTGISIGIALFPSDGLSCSELLKHSDAAMYLAKKSSGNHFRFYSEVS